VSKDTKASSLMDYLVKRLGPYTGRGPEFQFYCPFCIDRLGDESSKRKLWINLDKMKAHCWRCDYKAGGLRKVFMDMNGGVLRMDELRLLRGEFYPPVESLRASVTEALYSGAVEGDGEVKPVSIPAETYALEDFARARAREEKFPMEVRRGFLYLDKRGVEPEIIKSFHVGYCHEGRYAQRLVFPVIQNEEQVYFTTRTVSESDEKKSLNPPNEEGRYTKEMCLLNYDGVLGAETVSVVEGPFDCAAFPSAVGLMGKTISQTQVSLLAALIPFGLKEVVVALDSDAVESAEAIYAALLNRIPKVSILYLDHGDPWDRRFELEELMEGRSEPRAANSVKYRLARRTYLKRKKRREI
jgi:hypothetical protein